MKKLISIVLALVLVLTLAACSDRGTPTSTPGAATPTPAATNGGIDVNTATLKIALCVGQMDANPVNWDNGIKSVLAAYPKATYQVFNANGSAETQTQQFTDIINSGFNAIIVNAVDSAALSTVTTQAETAGIKVIDINNGPQAIHSGSIVNNAYNTGLLCADNAAKQLAGKNAKCVAIGAPVALATVVRGAQGFEDTIKSKYPNMTFLENQPGDWTTEKGNAVMRDFLTKYSNDIQVVFCQNDSMAIGAAQAIDAAGLTGKILVYGCDGLKEALQYVKDGKMAGSVYVDNVNCGALAANFALYAIASGIDGSKLAFTPTINLPAVVVDSSIVDNYLK